MPRRSSVPSSDARRFSGESPDRAAPGAGNPTLLAITTSSRHPGDELPEDALGLAAAVDVRGVEEVAAGVAVDAHDLGRGVLVAAPAGRAEVHRAEAERRHLEVGRAERTQVHGRRQQRCRATRPARRAAR